MDQALWWKTDALPVACITVHVSRQQMVQSNAARLQLRLLPSTPAGGLRSLRCGPPPLAASLSPVNAPKGCMCRLHVQGKTCLLIIPRMLRSNNYNDNHILATIPIAAGALPSLKASRSHYTRGQNSTGRRENSQSEHEYGQWRPCVMGC